ncbi:hypothetical protein pb186bvf_006770 [Paramecium bursaria]
MHLFTKINEIFYNYYNLFFVKFQCHKEREVQIDQRLRQVYCILIDLGDNSSIRINNDRLIVNRLGMKFDPVCNKKGHERGRIQFVCIEQNCNADRRLACAHCIIDDHEDHVQNKITVEQYVDTWEFNYKHLLFNLAKLEEQFNKSKLKDLLLKVERDIDALISKIHQQLLQIKDEYYVEIQEYCQEQNSDMFQNHKEHKINLIKMKEYFSKNLFEMTPSELDHSMLLIGSSYLSDIESRVHQFQENNINNYKFLNQKWKLIYEKLEFNIADGLDKPMTVHPEMMTLSQNQSPQESPKQLSPEPQFTIKPLQVTPAETVPNFYSAGGTHSQIHPASTLNKEIKKINGVILPSEIKSPLKSTKSKQVSPQLTQQGTHYYINQSAPKINHKHQYSMQQSQSTSIQNEQAKTGRSACNHQSGGKTMAVFTCCKQIFQCYECHDQIQNHKAHISQPSQRYCPQCMEIFTVGQLTTVDVACLRQVLITNQLELIYLIFRINSQLLEQMGASIKKQDQATQTIDDSQQMEYSKNIKNFSYIQESILKERRFSCSTQIQSKNTLDDQDLLEIQKHFIQLNLIQCNSELTNQLQTQNSSKGMLKGILKNKNHLIYKSNDSQSLTRQRGNSEY